MSSDIKRWIMYVVLPVAVLWRAIPVLGPRSGPLPTTRPVKEQNVAITLVGPQPNEIQIAAEAFITEGDVKWLTRATTGLGFNAHEFPDVIDAAKKNRCWTRARLALLLAIRKQEAGGPGIAYGILCKRGSSYRVQAGWCAATISKFLDGRCQGRVNELSIRKLAWKYTPEDRPGIWADNVLHWYLRITGAFHMIHPHPVWETL